MRRGESARRPKQGGGSAGRCRPSLPPRDYFAAALLPSPRCVCFLPPRAPLSSSRSRASLCGPRRRGGRGARSPSAPPDRTPRRGGPRTPSPPPPTHTPRHAALRERVFISRARLRVCVCARSGEGRAGRGAGPPETRRRPAPDAGSHISASPPPIRGPAPVPASRHAHCAALRGGLVGAGPARRAPPLVFAHRSPPSSPRPKTKPHPLNHGPPPARQGRHPGLPPVSGRRRSG